jgi:hypothetical protein
MLQNFLQTGLYYPKASIGVKRKKTASFLDWILGQLSLVLKRKAVFDAA